jgi:hypothetical protein
VVRPNHELVSDGAHPSERCYLSPDQIPVDWTGINLQILAGARCSKPRCVRATFIVLAFASDNVAHYPKDPGGIRMKKSLRNSLLMAGLALMVTGCHTPMSTPAGRLAKGRPYMSPHTNVLPPAQMMMHPGPGVDGPGPGVFMTGSPVSADQMAPAPTSQIGFIGMDGMQINWDVAQAGAFDSEPLIFPGNYNFGQGAIYRLKLTRIPGHEGVELYPTLEVAPTTPRSEAFLAHNYVPFQLTAEDFSQVLSGNFVTKVIYLPDAEHQELALAGVETLVSTRLDPGLDPITEADRKGTILGIIRLGNKNLQAGGGAAGGGVIPAGHAGMLSDNNCGPCGNGAGGNGVHQYIAGMSAPAYGMPITGTPIGLPGPAHIPLGGPAGLQQHTMRNWTHMHIPGPTEKLTIDVRQKPGLSVPKPPSHVHIVEKNQPQRIPFVQPATDRVHMLPGEMPAMPGRPTLRGLHGAAADCETGNCEPGASSYESQ